MVSCLGTRKVDSIVFICANWSMTCWSTVGHWKTTVGLAIDGCCVVSDHMLISILSVSVEGLEILCSVAVVTLTPLVVDLKAEDFYVCFKRLNPESISSFLSFSWESG